MSELEKDIDIFFDNMKSILSEDECDNDCSSCKFEQCIKIKSSNEITPAQRTTSDNNDTQRTNVIYLNTDCNLRCSYCYESMSRNGLPDQADCTPDMIDNFLNEICSREKNCTSTIVIMGGEPFLRFDLVQYTIAKAIQLSKSIKPNGFGISLITNATLFTDENLKQYKHLMEIGTQYNVNINFEISYDGSGHDIRCYEDGLSSKSIVEDSMFKLIEMQIPFKISYTVHQGNYKNVVEDCIYILEKFKSKYLTRITIGYAYQVLDNAMDSPHSGQILKSKILPFIKLIFEKYKIPICGHTCDICGICKKDNFIGNSYLSPTTGITYDEKTTEHEFRQF